jgi:hypothetical protein
MDGAIYGVNFSGFRLILSLWELAKVDSVKK